MLTPRQRAAAWVGLLAAMRARSIINTAVRRHRRSKSMTDETLPTHYYSQSKKADVPIKGMNYSQLKNTTLKVERTEPGSLTAKALRLELDDQEAAYAAQQAADAAGAGRE